jgi:hypothetical protein
MVLLKKPLAAALLLAGAAGGPYVLYETDAGQSARQSAGQALGMPNSVGEYSGSNSISTTSPGAGSSAATGTWWPFGGSKSQTLAGANPAGLTVTQISSLREVLRFDVPPAWVMQHFPIVNTGLGDGLLDGLRTPLVTGTRPDDLVGALTYYFDRFQRVQRITIHAVTGDPTRMTVELQTAFNLQQQPALGGGLYTTSWNGVPTSLMHITPAPVVTASPQQARFNVFLELNQPGLQYGLSSQSQNLLEIGSKLNRWR